MELAVMVVRTTSGSVTAYPVVETIHQNSILIFSIAPARICDALRIKAQKTAESAVATFSGAGIFGVEMFLCSDDSIYINEIAPRPHNSGHYTMDACVTSQFEVFANLKFRI